MVMKLFQLFHSCIEFFMLPVSLAHYFIHSFLTGCFKRYKTALELGKPEPKKRKKVK